MSQILVAFYSKTNATRTIANFIKELTNADLLDIEPETPYPKSYFATTRQAKVEIRDNVLPPIKNEIPDLSKYTTVFIGSPNWYCTIAPPVKTFLTKVDLSGKTVIVFNTNGGSGMGTAETDVQQLCPNSTFKEGYAAFGKCNHWDIEKVKEWLQKIEIIPKE